jgi:DnaJ-domain-containing protein 1
MPRRTLVIVVIAALLYVLFPRDLVPDFMVGWGWLDDALILFLLWRFYRRQRALRDAADRSGETGQDADEKSAGGAAWYDRKGRDPCAVLEIEPDASPEEIKAAYRRLAAQYHPDKVQHLGRDLQDLAETRFKEIQQAYDFLTRK